ncbi:MAG: hypothetical protein IJ587_08475, partial [Synergistaceae bacterium]|nr:hypothetical protein [Synergistaceae bacterium]
MRRSRAFVLSELLMTMLLQAGFILILCTSFYLLTSFYTKTQQVLTARNHAERVIQFMDDKIKHAGLGLWGCGDSAEIRARLNPIQKLKPTKLLTTDPLKGYNLPVALATNTNDPYNPPEMPDAPSDAKITGDLIAILYAQMDKELVMTFKTENPAEEAFKRISDISGNARVTILDDDADNNKSEIQKEN